MKPTFFATPRDFRAWLQKHHAKATELLVGFYKRGSGRPSITWPESVDEALCYGWIDGIRKTLGEESYTIRFTPRRKDSTWSLINIARAKALTMEGRMRPAGEKAFAARGDEKAAAYSYEQRHSATFPPAFERRFRENRKAWAFFQAQPPWYRRTVTYWVVSAKKEETRERRLAALIADSEHERPIRATS